MDAVERSNKWQLTGGPALARHQNRPVLIPRRGILALAAPLALGLTPLPLAAKTLSGTTGARGLSLHNLHTGERETVDYWVDGAYQPEALARIDHLLRDFRTGEAHPMDRKLLDLLYVLRGAAESEREFEIISGYRSPKTNRMLNNKSAGVAKRSLHMQGKAVDVRLPGLNLKKLHREARGLRAGGVGFYPRSGFVHVDVGRVRYW